MKDRDALAEAEKRWGRWAFIRRTKVARGNDAICEVGTYKEFDQEFTALGVGSTFDEAFSDADKLARLERERGRKRRGA